MDLIDAIPCWLWASAGTGMVFLLATGRVPFR